MSEARSSEAVIEDFVKGLTEVSFVLLLFDATWAGSHSAGLKFFFFIVVEYFRVNVCVGVVRKEAGAAYVTA